MGLKRNLSGVFKQLTLLTQFGLSLITPLLMCLLLCYYLTYRFNIGVWVYIIGFFFGLGGSFMTGYKFYLANLTKEKDKKTKSSFNRHM
ncbi:MAG: AtpZ/AtpI family protein [Lachnospiraceae bacterium]|nr:AtpZ/AtpI family protein [Lachnospiraceae bacterium]